MEVQSIGESCGSSVVRFPLAPPSTSQRTPGNSPASSKGWITCQSAESHPTRSSLRDFKGDKSAELLTKSQWNEFVVRSRRFASARVSQSCRSQREKRECTGFRDRRGRDRCANSVIPCKVFQSYRMEIPVVVSELCPTIVVISSVIGIVKSKRRIPLGVIHASRPWGLSRGTPRCPVQVGKLIRSRPR